MRIVGLRSLQRLIHGYNQSLRASRKRHPDTCIFLHIQERCQREHGTLQGTDSVLQRIACIHHIKFQRQQICPTDGSYLQALHADAIKRISRHCIFLCQVIFGLRHGKGKEVGSGLLGHLFGIIKVLFLRLLVLQRFNLALPTERIITDQTLRIAHTHRHTGELSGLVIAETPHISQFCIQIERTSRQIKILPDGKVPVSIE